MKAFKHYVIIYRYLTDDDGVYTIRFTTSQYLSYVKEFRRIKKSSCHFLIDYYEVLKSVRIVNEKRIISHTAI